MFVIELIEKFVEVAQSKRVYKLSIKLKVISNSHI